MNEEQHHALASVQFGSVLGPDEVWSPLSYHVDGLHPHAVQEITRRVGAAAKRPNSTPTGLVLSGERGVGKTHMLGWLRQHVQGAGGAFFMPKLIDGQSFWTGAVHGIVAQLLGSDGGQLGRMLGTLAELTGCGQELSMRLRGMLQVSRADIDEFVDRVGDLDPGVALHCRDTLRALVLFKAKGGPQEIGLSFLTLEDGIEEADRLAWGFRRPSRLPQLIFGDVSRLFALAGPVVLAVDQIDSVIAQSGSAAGDTLADRLADGLMQLREETTRTLIVVACIPKSWEILTARAVNSAADRFTVVELSTAMPSAGVATAIVERHLGSLYGEAGFEPPYPTWPVLPAAFDDRAVADHTPRRLLQRVEEHVRQCLAANEIRELRHFTDADHDPGPVPVPSDPTDLAELDRRFAELRAGADVISPMDSKYEDSQMFSLLNAALCCYVLEQGAAGQQFTVDPPAIVQQALHARLRRTLDEATEDEEHWSFRAIAHSNPRAVLTRLRSASLEAGIGAGVAKRHLIVLRNTGFSPGPVTKAAVADFEAARGLALPVSQDDLRVFTALEIMLTAATPGFLAWLARRRPASGSQLLTRVLGAVSARVESDGAHAVAGGPGVRVIGAGPDAVSGSGAGGWEPVGVGTGSREPVGVGTGSREPVGVGTGSQEPAGVGTGSQAPAGVGTGSQVPAGVGVGDREPVGTGVSDRQPVGIGAVGIEIIAPEQDYRLRAEPRIADDARADAEPSILLGHGVDTGAAFRVPLIQLRKHTAVFAGSGSGKTVLLRRLVEEAALAGVSSILVDTNNDLARLGDRWPTPPAGWGARDPERAQRYFDDTEVVVWTPRRESGRPLALNPLPEFADVLEDPDEFRTAIDASVAGLLPRTGLTAQKLRTGTAVLTEALTYFARRGGSDLSEFVALLANLPEGISTIRNAVKLAEGMADELHAAMVNDPVFGGAGERLDPGVLLTPAAGKRARISVISCIGLATEEQRQTFVNQLELALFAWIKRHPAGDRPLGGLLVLDEAQTFAPSNATKASTESTLKLATQARKYGLGLVFATQAPKALHNLITGNAATQFFGLLNASVQIQAAKELARAKGGRVEDISRLSAGRFYGATEGLGFSKLSVPMCLSHHPASALTEDEVLDRARR
ncbi:ATP-binding protein [Nocardia sp. NPDC055321]